MVLVMLGCSLVIKVVVVCFVGDLLYEMICDDLDEVVEKIFFVGGIIIS